MPIHATVAIKATANPATGATRWKSLSMTPAACFSPILKRVASRWSADYRTCIAVAAPLYSDLHHNFATAQRPAAAEARRRQRENRGRGARVWLPHAIIGSLDDL